MTPKRSNFWLTHILAVLAVTAVVLCLAELAESSDASDLTTDSQYTKILSEIHEKNLDPEKIQSVLHAEKSPSKRFLEDSAGLVILGVSYNFIFRCVARLLLGRWISPWRSRKEY